MQVVLLERVEKLGQMGEIVQVKDGYARNFLLPRKKALRATKENMVRFEEQRAQLEARNLELRSEAEKVQAKIEGLTITVLRQAGDTGQLYGSVTTRDISDGVTTSGFSVNRNQVALEHPIKNIGLHKVRVALHPEVTTIITVNVARTAEEATRQAAGEDLTRRDQDDDIDPTKFFESNDEEAVEAEVEGEEAAETEA
ncbi:MAG: 50S ribosomal protein L9 [Parvibaculaceae bacterium]